jgi:hypothetical protein
MAMVNFSIYIQRGGNNSSFLLDTSASYAGNWLTTFFANTLNNTYLMENALILLTFDEVRFIKNE